MDKVAILARVSTDKQEYQRQVNELTDYCSRVGWNVEATFCNKISGAKSLAILFLPRYKTEGQSRVPQMARSGDCNLAIGTEAKTRLPGALKALFAPEEARNRLPDKRANFSPVSTSTIDFKKEFQ